MASCSRPPVSARCAATIEDTMPPEQSAKMLAFAAPQIDRAVFSASTIAWP